MKDKVLSAIKQNSMLSMGDRVTVALSGGADSVALLCVLNELSSELEISVSACHINHCLRGEESDGDQLFCQTLCERLEIPFEAVSVDVKGYCLENKLSTEEGARKLRYDALLNKCKAGKLATAHTLSDNAETVILNMVRGTALDGLCGIPPVRDNIIRPLIYCTRSDVEDYLRSIDVGYVTDSSNLGDDYRRNKIRHHIIPAFKDFNVSFEETIGRMCDSLREDKEFLNSLADSVLKNAEIPQHKMNNVISQRLKDIYPLKVSYDINIILSENKPVIMRCLRMMLERSGISYDAKRLHLMETLIAEQNGSINLSDDSVFICGNGRAEIIKSFPALKVLENKISFNSKDFVLQITDDLKPKLEIRELTEKEIKLFVNNRPLRFKNAIDCDKINGVVTVRGRRPGDKYRLINGKYTTTFKNLFNSASLPAAVRDSLIVLSDESGVIWLEGFGACQRVAVTSNTHKAFLVDISEE